MGFCCLPTYYSVSILQYVAFLAVAHCSGQGAKVDEVDLWFMLEEGGKPNICLSGCTCTSEIMTHTHMYVLSLIHI